MTAEVFESVEGDHGDDAMGIRNTLSIEAREHWAGEQEIAVVQVDTNYKATRQGDYPVNLTLVDALNAATALVRVVMAAYEASDDRDPVGLLRGLSLLDSEVLELREVLLCDVQRKTGEES
jgi:hypothetical protein